MCSLRFSFRAISWFLNPSSDDACDTPGIPELHEPAAVRSPERPCQLTSFKLPRILRALIARKLQSLDLPEVSH